MKKPNPVTLEAKFAGRKPVRPIQFLRWQSGDVFDDEPDDFRRSERGGGAQRRDPPAHGPPVTNLELVMGKSTD
jgi:hypothetical protein